jgi:myo-inositol-1(or 4)-monophosphatase
MPGRDIADRLAAAVPLAEQAGEIALNWFRAAPDVTNKAGPGVFDPVTAADHAVEEFLRDELTSRFPDDTFFGEETGESGAAGPYRWVVDPIDGTRAFISGNPLWGILIGLELEGQAIAGIVRIPYLTETFTGDNERAFLLHEGRETPLHARDTSSLAEAIICTTTPEMFEGEEANAFERLSRACRLTRYGGDCYSYCLLAMGHVDLVAENGLQPYDIVALAPIIHAAGGIVTTATGAPAEQGGFIVAAANNRLHEQAIATLNNP